MKTIFCTLALATALVQAAPADSITSKVTPPAASALLLKAHAVGYQVYGCLDNGEWSKSEPIAALVTDKGAIIRHYRDTAPVAPAWEAADATKVHAFLANGSPDQTVPSATPQSIPQLGLKTVPNDSKGTFGAITYVIRANTKGGVHPEGPCNLAPGERRSVYYEADYFFYTKAQR